MAGWARGIRWVGWVVMGYLCWVGMMGVHEVGHVVAAWASGGRVEGVVVPLFGFSRTDVGVNPHPLVVAWGGPVLGCLIPSGIVGVWRMARGRAPGAVRAFEGFCWVANGAYIGAGAVVAVGDARVMGRWGTPGWVMGVFGVVAVGIGLWEWHRVVEEGRKGRGDRS